MVVADSLRIDLNTQKAMELWNLVSQAIIICISGYSATKAFVKAAKLRVFLVRRARGIDAGKRAESSESWYLVRLLIIIVLTSFPVEFVLFSHGEWSNLDFIRRTIVPTGAILVITTLYLVMSRLFFLWWYRVHSARPGLRTLPSSRWIRTTKLLAVGAIVAVFYHLIRWLIVVQEQGWI